MAAAFGKLLRTRGDEAKRCSNRETPLSPGKLPFLHQTHAATKTWLTALQILSTVKREISLLAAYFR